MGQYTWYDGLVAGLGIGGGVRYVGESFGDSANTILIPDYDATISHLLHGAAIDGLC